MILSFAEYLRRINPTHRNTKGQWVIGSEPRKRAFQAARDALLAGAGASSLRSAVAISTAAAQRYSAEIAAVWKLVRRYHEHTPQEPRATGSGLETK